MVQGGRHDGGDQVAPDKRADLVCVDMFRVYVSKLRVVAEEGVGQPKAERESRSVLVGKDT